MTESEVLDKIHQLPEPVQKHLFLYVDFLYNTYSESSTDAASKVFLEEFELTETGRNWLEERAQQALSNRAKRMSWEEARSKVHQKHGLPQ
jgi:hypothetical protein